MDGWTVEVEFPTGASTSAQSNQPAERIPCEAKLPDSTGSRDYSCPPNTAANKVYVKGSANPSKLAEIVIGGNAWDKFPCEKGYYNPGTGKHSESGQDCQVCNDGERNHERGKTTCTPCDNSSKNIFYTVKFDHKTEPGCQVCLNYQVANGDKNGCMDCPAGKEFETAGCSAENPTTPTQLLTCSTVVCRSCPGGKFREGLTADETCTDCLVNQYSSVGAPVCKGCEKHKHSSAGSETCTDCLGQTYQDMIANEDMKENDKKLPVDEFNKCLMDTGEACVTTSDTISAYGTYDLGHAQLGEEKAFNCEFDCTNPDPAVVCDLKAVFTCVELEGGKLGFTPFYNCSKTRVTNAYAELNKQGDKNKELSAAFKKLSEDSLNSNGLGDLEQAAEIIDSISDQAQDEVNDEVLSNLIGGVSNIVEGDLTTDNNQRSNVLNRVVESLTKVTSNTKDANSLATSTHIAVMKVTGGAKVSEGGGTTKFSLPKSELKGLSNLKVETSGEEPLLMVSAEDEGDLAKDVAVLIFQESNLFPNTDSTPDPDQMKDDFTLDTDDENKAKLVNSLVVEVSAVGDKDKPYKLGLYMKPLANVGGRNTSIKTFPDGRKAQLKNTCHSFNTHTETWVADCETVYDKNEGDSKVLCICQHNTSFAVLMSPYPIDPGFIKSQTLMSTIILSLSMICLSLTIVCLASAAPIRKQRSTKINICFSFSLLLASFLFLLQNALVKSDDSGAIKPGSAGCIVYAAIQHYLWLVVFLWMVVEGILMYLSLVQVFGSHISKYMLKFNLLCWGVPIIFPIIGYFAFTKTVTIGDYSVVKSDFLAESMCFLKPGGIPFWVFFFLPLMLALLLNVVFFILVLRVIKQSKSATATESELLLRQIKAAVGVMALLGTGWLIGVFMTIPEPSTQITLQYIFILLNSSQGICVFLFYVVLNEQVTNHWLTTFGLKTKVASSSSTATTAATAPAKDKGATTAAATPDTENVYENAAAASDKDTDDHTYDTAFPAKSEENGNI
ncbi:adhesion G-protein coupled receptor G7-like [Bolinopsis microptera]|uniref:adhesion G-protein coupled receptor G7-like n=1 Tax=Bolinopsis microptera TaxID=2820187 RepID=UPI0030794D05